MPRKEEESDDETEPRRLDRNAGGNESAEAADDPGLFPPRLVDGKRVDGSNKRILRKENKTKRIAKQEEQSKPTFWTEYQGDFEVPASVDE